mgnify:CR=1 FL=1
MTDDQEPSTTVGSGGEPPAPDPVTSHGPTRVLGDHPFGHGYAGDLDYTPPKSRYSLIVSGAGDPVDRFVEDFNLMRLYVNEEKRRRAVWQPFGNLPGKIALDKPDGH